MFGRGTSASSRPAARAAHPAPPRKLNSSAASAQQPGGSAKSRKQRQFPHRRRRDLKPTAYDASTYRLLNTTGARMTSTLLPPAPPAPPLYRLHIKTDGEDRAAVFEFCRDGGFLGVGWAVGDRPLDWGGYEARAVAQDGGVNPSVRAIHEMPDGALIWTRDTRGAYYLARVLGGWRYLHDERAAACDMRNIRPVLMLACGVESRVPGAVLSSFIPRRALQRVLDDAARAYSASLFAELAGDPAPWQPTLDHILTTCLSAKDLEDLVCAYLQRERGYLVLAASRRVGTPAYEYVLRHPDDGHEAVAQVKGGHAAVSVDAASLPTAEVERVYAFSPTGSYGGDLAPNVDELGYDDITGFMRGQRQCLPPMVEHWVRQAADAG